MISRSLVLNPVEPAMLSMRHPLGVNLELRLKLKNQRGVPVDPSGSVLILLPRSRGGVDPYDVTTLDPVNGLGKVEVHGSSLIDVSGYNLELYSRTGSPALPTGLLAKGHLATEGSAYSIEGGRIMANPVVVTGPPGPPGPSGARGAYWFTGNGAPTQTLNVLSGDMYLDKLSGDIWQHNGSMWVLT